MPEDIILAAGSTNSQKKQIFNTLQQLSDDNLISITRSDGTIQIKIGSLGKGNKSAGTRLIRRLNSSDRTVTIDFQNSQGNFSNGTGNKAKGVNLTDATNGTGTDSVVSFDPTSSPRIKTEDPKTGNTINDTSRPNYIGLGHELIHSEHHMDGDQNSGSDRRSYTYRSTSGTPKKEIAKTEELRTIGIKGNKKDDITENQLRKENNLYKRVSF